MNKEIIMYSLLLLFSVFISSISQVILKKSALKNYSSKLKEYLNFLVISAYFLFFLSTIMTVFSYRKVPLSFGSILEATSYIYITIFGIKIFNERINKRKIIALIFILFGIIIYAYLG